MKTIGEIVIDFKLMYSYRVSNLKKEEMEEKGIKGKIFHKIIIELFEKYGAGLGYKDYHSFQGDIMNLKILKNVSQEDDEIEENISETKAYIPKEGDGESFLFYQIESFNLNPESY